MDQDEQHKRPLSPGQSLPDLLRTRRIRASCGCILDWWTWCKRTPGSSLKAQPGGPIDCPVHRLGTIVEIVANET